MEEVTPNQNQVVMEEALQYPTPLGSYVLIANPLFGIEALEPEVEKLPEKDRKAFVQEKLGDIWESIVILGKGHAVVALEVGDKVISDSSILDGAIPIQFGKYLFVRESKFVGKW
jgi:hypothetical protein